VIALAGRRIDPPDAEAVRFPPAAISLVRRELADLMQGEQSRALVCSAACGADLIALQEAGRLGIRRRVVLPFPPARFRERSVADRPGEWGAAFDRVIDEVRRAGDLVILHLGDGEQAFAATNEAIVAEAKALCKIDVQGTVCRAIAVIVWEGATRPGNDITERFRELAERVGFEVEVVRTA
jgi:hypothetical protein